jgi:hypothetical protein
MNIYQRVNAVRKAISYIQKDKAVSTGGGSYKAVTHDAVTGLVRAALIEHGIVIVPTLIDCEFHAKEQDSKQRLYEATYQINFVNMDTPGEVISVQINAHALDNGDKAPGKAISYATKYAILKLFNIETGDDDESRYQREEFDVVPYLQQIESCDSLQALQAVFTEAYKIVTQSGDKVAAKALISSKDAAKSRIQKVPA